jgi:hypothetical protein
MKFAMSLAKHGKVPPPVPPHVADKVDEARALHDLVQGQDRRGFLGHVQGERGIARMELAVSEDPDHGAASRDSADVTPGKRPTRRGAD